MLWRKKETNPVGDFTVDGVSYAIVRPPKSWLSVVKAEHTPDLVKLEQRTQHLVFVYDQFQRKHYANKCLDNSKFECIGFTLNLFQLWRKNLGKVSYPIALRGGDPDVPDFYGIQKLRIRGELWNVSTPELIELDNIKANGLHYVREKVRLLIPYRRMVYRRGNLTAIETHTTAVRAWMYVGLPAFWVNQLDGGFAFKPVRHFEANTPMVNGEALLKHYYQFTPLEYQDF
jgi:AIG2-like family.